MSKPLKLTIHPPVSRFTRELIDYNIAQGLAPYFGITAEMHAPGLMAMHTKRFAEAELCAEYEAARCDAMIQSATGRCWAPLFDTWPMDPESIHNRARTLHRFATHPHYFEATEPESDTE